MEPNGAEIDRLRTRMRNARARRSRCTSAVHQVTISLMCLSRACLVLLDVSSVVATTVPRTGQDQTPRAEPETRRDWR